MERKTFETYASKLWNIDKLELSIIVDFFKEELDNYCDTYDMVAIPSSLSTKLHTNISKIKNNQKLYLVTLTADFVPTSEAKQIIKNYV